MPSYQTPSRKKKKGGQKKGGPSPQKSRAKAVDLVTGKTKVEYFFDPTQILDANNNGDTASATTPFKTPSKRNLQNTDSSLDSSIYSAKHLFVPCTIVKSLVEEDDSQDKKSSEDKAAKVKDGSGPALVKTSDGTLYKIREANDLTTLTAPDDYIGMSDILHLANVSEASLLHTLRIRYKRDDIYTSAGPILISINPYKFINVDGESLYSHDTMMRYRQNESFGDQQKPHLFQVADRAYSAMMDSVHNVPHLEEEDAAIVLEGDIGISPGQARNQSIIISGESGAGKTEATKFIMQYLARITKKKSRVSDKTCQTPDGKVVVAALEDRVLSSNPLLETFGNAQTLRNDNSSRFGKYIHINFSTETGAIVGAQVSNYLLEKTRITQQIEGERNYHIFYQLFAGANPAVLEELGLAGGASSFKYLGSRPSHKTKKDEANYQETVECLAGIGLATEEQEGVFAFAAAVLHLGNVTFEESDSGDHSAVVSEATRPSLQKACILLGLNEEAVTEAILTKLLTIGGKTIKKPSTVAMAEDKRDALAKMTYSCVFLWLVESINSTLSHPDFSQAASDENMGFIGVLDIYGFETFEVNGYEQLLINYCNEKLQRHFNRHLFEVEQNLYSTEGVDWTYITFNDNRPCLELIEGGSGKGGILSTLDDSYAGMGDAGEKDIKFVGQLHKLFGSVAGAKKAGTGHEYFVTPKFGNDRQFIIVHYAGEVKYTADGFVEKNMESLTTELKELGDSSTIDLAKAVYAHATDEADASQQAGNRRSSIRGFSVASQFKLSLQSLVEDLERTQPHYIRCLKPNLKKAANSFASGEVLKQLRYSGMMEAIRIRREGYALREPHQSFYNRFSVLLGPEELGEDAGIEQLVIVLSKRLKVTDADWQIGHSKIFLRRDLSEKLERLAKLRVHAAARSLGRFGRNLVERRLSSLLVNWVKFRLVMLQKYKKYRAASKIQSIYHMNKQGRIYARTRKAIIVVQSVRRRHLALHRVRKIRDPYCEMTFKDIKELIKTEKARMEKAVGAQDFREAAEIEAKMETLTEIMESKKPKTRKWLEDKIAKVQTDMEDALKRKAYTEAGPLQDELETLVEKRNDLPTMVELTEAVRKAERGVASAAKKRDFAAAAASQADLDDARRCLEAALDADQDSDDENADYEVALDIQPAISIEGFDSRSDLENEISSLLISVEEAISKKDFKKASELQTKINGREELRVFFPSLDELETELSKSKATLDDAIASKDFTRAAQLHEEIDRLEKQVVSEREKTGLPARGEEVSHLASITSLDGEEKTFDSRFALEEEMKVTKVLQGQAVVSKEFKRAEACQQLIEDLENLRANLPTVAELGKAIKEKKMEMKKAISGKRFGEAESLDQEIVALEENLASEKAKAPQPETKPMAASTSKIRQIVVATASPEKKIAVVAPKVLPLASAVVKALSKSESMPLASPVSNGATSQTAGALNYGGTSKSSVIPSSPTLNNGPSSASVRRLPDSDRVPSFKSSKDKADKSSSVKTSESGKYPSTENQSSVSKLRPKKPILSKTSASVVDVCKMLASRRGDAAVVLNDAGELAGIITDTDITRRVVAKHLHAGSTSVDRVMTSDPTCVAMADSAMDAMSIMVANHFRHLPVIDGTNRVVGVLDIAKCLNDAISKLEKSESKKENLSGETLLQAMKAQGAEGQQVAALQALLGPLMQQAFGNQSSPTLRSLLEDAPATLVKPNTSVVDAGVLMAERRKAALVVDKGQLVGIFGFKDMMTRVVAKELPLELTKISEVMTPNPDAVSPETTVLEALQMMHDNKFLTLPVCEDNGTVVGLVDVMDVIYGCGGAEGWRSIFGSTLDLDDLSDSDSLQSGVPAGSIAKTLDSPVEKKQAIEAFRSVSKLRPKKPLIASASDSVLSVTQMLASKRGDAALLVSDQGGLAGIITDTDVTRRVVAKHLDAASTQISHVMTPNPTCVAMADPAMDAMSTMVENHFRHLPVVDENGGVVGLLDIAKCLNDAISKLEKSDSKTENTAGDALVQAMNAQGAQGAQAAALQALLGPLMAKAFGNQSSPTLRSILAGKPGTIVSPDTSVLDTGMIMAERRKAALVVEDGGLVGIFGFKDMMTRVVAKELQMELTSVSAVMTPNPESVSPEMTVLDALQAMHDNKFLTLPVCEDDGTVVGVVDVMDVIYGCGGAEGWRSIFSSALDLEDSSETGSVHSGLASTGRSTARTASRSIQSKLDSRSVSMLRPKKPLISADEESILSVAKMLASNRGDSAIIVNNAGGLAGIITDTDFTRRVVAKGIDPEANAVSEVMTREPKFVSTSDSALDAMMVMIENHFRHLPVSDDDGAVVGVLDIAKCLNDAISKLEKSSLKKSGAAESLIKEALEQSGQGAAALQTLLGPMVSQAFGDKASRSLRSILSGSPSTVVSPETTVQAAAVLMTESRKAALVVEDDHLVGIFGFKDMMSRVIAKELDVDSTMIEEVMTPNPESVHPDMTVLEALQTMHDHRFLTLPVCEDDGTVVGLVDVMDVINACGGVDGWRAVFDSALDIDDDVSAYHSMAQSTSRHTASVSRPATALPPIAVAPPRDPMITVSKDAPFVSPSKYPGNIPMTLEFQEGGGFDEGGISLNDTFLSDFPTVTFKIVDLSGHTHRLKSDIKIASLQKAFSDKVKISSKKRLRFKFVDDEGDAIMVTSDDDLLEAVKIARTSMSSSPKAGSPVVVKLTAVEIEDADGISPSVLAGIGIAVALAGVAAMVVLRPKRF